MSLTTLSASEQEIYPSVTLTWSKSTRGKITDTSVPSWSYSCLVAACMSSDKKWMAARRRGGNLEFFEVGFESMVCGASIGSLSSESSDFSPVRLVGILVFGLWSWARGTLSICKRSIIALERSSTYGNVAKGNVLTQVDNSESDDVRKAVGISDDRTTANKRGTRISTSARD